MKKIKLIFVLTVLSFCLVGCTKAGLKYISELEKEKRQNSIEDARGAIDEVVYWTSFDKVYHLPLGEVDEDGNEIFCPSMNCSATIYMGSVESAIQAGRTKVCPECASRE